MIPHIDRKYFRLSVGKLKKDTDTDMSCCCPLCGDTKNRLHLYSSAGLSLVHCFNSSCELEEKHHSLKNFLKMIHSPYEASYRRETFTESIEDLKNESNIQDILNKINIKKTKQVVVPLPLDKLFMRACKSDKAIEYIKARGFDPKSDWFFSEDSVFEYNTEKIKLKNCIIFPIYENKSYKGFYTRSIYKKEFFIFLLPGTEKIWVQGDLSDGGIITEGLFDALSTGFENCAAMLGADLSKEFMSELSKNTIFAFDNDKTGVSKAIKYTKLGFKIFVWPDYIKEKDFNELLISGWSKNEIKKLINANIFTGILAETKLKMKEV